MPSTQPATTTPPATLPSTLPDGIEIFRAGRHLDDAGVAHHFSEADLDGMAASYSPALREAPLTVGHPKDNLPAYGWVKAVARTPAGTLAITPHQVEPQFAEMVQAGRFKKRSASFYPPGAPHNPTPGRWYLRLPKEAKLPAFTSPAQALGDDVFEHIPAAPEARRWRVLSSEAQVVLHNHPHNAARAAAGKPPINSLWFWGGGVLPDHVASQCPTVYSDDVLLHGLARVGKLACMPLDAAKRLNADALIDLRAQRDPRAMLEHWLSPTAMAPLHGEVAFDFADGVVFTLVPGQRWRFWRKPLAAIDA